MKKDKLDILFEHLAMPNLTLKNRFFMAPMGTGFGIDELTGYLVARAKGEVALVTVGAVSVHPGGRTALHKGLRLETDEDIKVLSGIANKVQQAGARIVVQLNHSGRYFPGRLFGERPVAPSPIASRYTGETPRELSTYETDDLVMAFSEAAVRAQKAGFDGVEFTACSGYLISQFLSPLTNKREDRYGGNSQDRATFLLTILRKTRKAVGSGFNICVKFDAEDSVVGGRNLEESLILAPNMVEAGADRLHVWAGWHEATRPMLPMFVPRGAFSHLAAAIKKTVNVPISTVGRINDPYVAADILEKGEADLVGLGRALLCDPDFVKKTMDGRTREIRHCMACCYCFDTRMLAMRNGTKEGLKCSLNPELGHEEDGLVQVARKKKHVVVIGGGPAGMEVARLAAVRGHRVTLYEKESRLGGMINLASVPPHKGELGGVADYYNYQMKFLPVEIKLGKPITFEELDQMKPDAIVVAIGAKEFIPDIPGIRKKHVFTALQVLKGSASPGEKTVVIGGGMIGLETAEFLVDQGKKVTVIEKLDSVAADVGNTTRWGFLSRLRRKIDIQTLTEVLEIKRDSVIVQDQYNNRTEISADSVVIARGLVGENKLGASLVESGIDYFVVGSCRKPGKIAEAIHDAFSVGCNI